MTITKNNICNMKKLTLLVLISFLTGCATIMNDASKSVQISSNIPSANYTIKNKTGTVVQNGVSPSSAMLKVAAGAYSGEKYTIDFSKEGYIPSSTIIDSEVSGWWFGNLLFFGGILGFAVIDPITGKMWTLPDSAVGNLSPAYHDKIKTQ